MKPYPDQILAVNAALKRGQGIIQMPTGTGKSFVARMIIEAFNLKTLIIVPNLGLKEQMIETMKGLKNVKVENIDNPALKTLTDFDLLIGDEWHHSASKTYRKLNKTAWTKIYYRIFFSATPFRNDSEEALLLESIAGQVIYKLSYKDAVAKGYIVPVDSYFFNVPKQHIELDTYPEVYSKFVVHNEARNIIIGALLARLSDIPTLCIVREIAHGKILSKMTGIPFVYGEDKTTKVYIEQFKRGEIKSLIGTAGVLGEGQDTKPAEYVINAGLIRAKSQFMQIIGRGSRVYSGKDSVKIILFRDASHRYLIRHFNDQKKILLDEYDVTPVRLEL
jgi:superfamily II DNA or RNA helicase